jgi:hypothetical protein
MGHVLAARRYALLHSITSSARASSEGGAVRPSAFYTLLCHLAASEVASCVCALRARTPNGSSCDASLR